MKKLLLPVIFILTAFGGVMYVAHRGYWGVSLKKEVDPTALATLAVGILIALFLERYFTKTAGEDRAEKDLLLAGLKDCDSALRGCKDALLDADVGPVERRKILKRLRALANSFEAFETALSESACKTLLADTKALVQLYLSYKRELTGGNFPTKGYSAAQAANYERIQRGMQRAMQKLIFRINRF